MAKVKFTYTDAANYHFVNTIEVDAERLAAEDIKVDDEIEVTKLGISELEWSNPKYRNGHTWDVEDDHTIVTIDEIIL